MQYLINKSVPVSLLHSRLEKSRPTISRNSIRREESFICETIHEKLNEDNTIEIK